MRVVFSSLLSLSVVCSSAWAVEIVPATAPTSAPTTAAATSPQPSSTTAKAVPATQVQPNAIKENKPLTAEQIAKEKASQEAKVKALVKNQTTRLQQLEKANLDALAQNQELQLKNDNLGVQIQVLQSERSAQMFLYGAVTLATGVILGFLLSGYIYTKRRRQW